jgi:hypothetical protein
MQDVMTQRTGKMTFTFQLAGKGSSADGLDWIRKVRITDSKGDLF